MEWVGEQYDGCKHNGQLLKVERQRTQYTLRASKDHPFNTNTHIPAHAEREGGLREKVVEEWAATMRGLQMDVERGEVTEKWKSGEIHKHAERGGSRQFRTTPVGQALSPALCCILHAHTVPSCSSFSPFSKDGRIQQRSHSLCERPHVPMSRTLKSAKAHWVIKTKQGYSNASHSDNLPQHYFSVRVISKYRQQGVCGGVYPR